MEIISATPVEWVPYQGNIGVRRNTIHLFKIKIDSYYRSISTNYRDVLSDFEINKASRFLNHNDLTRYIVTKYGLRKILAYFIPISPSQIQFHLTANKKPAVIGIEFNVTHSGNFVLIAISTSPIGIDVEFINRNFNFEPLIETILSEDEFFFMEKSLDKLIYFYMLWTRKEALLKATGEGLVDNLKDICTSTPIVNRFGVNFNVKSILIDHQYMMSTATQIDSSEINYWSYEYM